jgi:hypothetical protein
VTNWKFLKFRKIDEIWYNYTRLKWKSVSLDFLKTIEFRSYVAS